MEKISKEILRPTQYSYTCGKIRINKENGYYTES